VDRFARVVLGYHGCTSSFAELILSGKAGIADWRASKNSYDWLGDGIYFWEHAPERARAWRRRGDKTNHSSVIGAVIQLGVCLDFTDIRSTELLAIQYQELVEDYSNQNRALPRNENGRQILDCLVVNQLIQKSSAISERFQTVRCPFLEGEAAFPGSGILKESHIQISVIDRSCILGVFRPNLDF
jgi:hypothetical protein